ncbi:MAG: hypothetical protein UR60_C0019G0023 [Candidatus Moranbacteria bacterium GW2011_GWF2_34_56]|nr:MAG: hypothetical protein UR51_C0006G0017 [Candidatus Moranbacteria bacterium GW2011_GWF1_34_10]KKP64568.1 MAG: hypothetical protein UR60_C0019G0023 [Candidatus Moranbacteria bacterium GW2011_GWF2_34_56]HBI16660.1 GxxExxY protein [Candidatus Moranbacteria bacterium]
MDNLEKVIYADESYKLNGIFFKAHNELGPYCREIQYCDALEKLFVENNIPYNREVCLEPESDLIKKSSNRVDFVVYDKIIIEVKAVRFVGREEYNQVQRYLKTFNIKLGLLVNFQQRYLKPKRIINSTAKE